MEKLTYVCVYLDYRESLATYSEAEKGRLLTAMLDYAATGQEPDFPGIERHVWPFLRSRIDRDMEQYREKVAANRRNGALGGRPRKKPADPAANPEEPKAAIPTQNNRPVF